MKIRLLFLMTIIGMNTLIAQVRFCPPGAKWHFLVRTLAGGNPQSYNSTNNYEAEFNGRTKIGPDSVSILKSGYFFTYCGAVAQHTYIKESNNVVYFQNKFTEYRWQTLFDFNATKNQSWTDTLVDGTSPDERILFTVTVDSSYSVIHNSQTLISLNLSYEMRRVFFSDSMILTYTSTATQLFGGSLGIFNFNDGSAGICDMDHFDRMLCYEDPVLGVKKFSSLSCEYENPAGVAEANHDRVKIMPNPTNGKVALAFSFDYDLIEVLDFAGRSIFKSPNVTAIDLSQHPGGLYFIVIKENDKTSVHKLVKE